MLRLIASETAIMKPFKFTIISLIIVITAISFSYWYSHYTNYTDFPVFYNASSYFLRENKDIANIYDLWIANEYNLPERTHDGKFIYSPLALVLISPLAYLEYYTAKTVLMSVNIICYVLSVYLILCQFNLSGRWFVYPFLLSLIWPAFLNNVMMGQVNSILLLLLILAVNCLKNSRPVSSGLLIGVAALFKIFPIGIAMTLGIKNWRVFISCFLLFIVSLIFVPGSIKWFSAIQSITPSSVSPAYHLLTSLNPSLFWIYSGLIALTTALLIYKTRVDNYLKVVSYTIPAIFLAAPVFESHHLTLLIVSYLFILIYVRSNFRLIYTIKPTISVLVIALSYFLPGLEMLGIHNLYYFSILLLWLLYSYIFISDVKRE